MSTPLHENYITYPEAPLRNRIKLAYDWIPENCHRLLDAGCAFGYGTRHFKTKAVEAYGVDPNAEFIAVAQRRYPNITFRRHGVEHTSFDPEYFDVIILNDVLEHVRDERLALNEIHRLLRPGGTCIITTPHRGLFGFMDPDNLFYHLRTKAPHLYRWLYRAKYGKAPPQQIKPGYEQLHRHYNRPDFIRLLDNSDFQGKYEVEKVFRGGLLIGVLASHLYEFLSLAVGVKYARRLLAPLNWLADIDFFIPYGSLSYNIGLRIKKRMSRLSPQV